VRIVSPVRRTDAAAIIPRRDKPVAPARLSAAADGTDVGDVGFYQYCALPTDRRSIGGHTGRPANIWQRPNPSRKQA
jgi:hypothetical protein